MDSREAFIVSLKNRYNQYLGAPTTPVDVAYRMVDMSRRMGKTRIMIETLPEDGRAIILTWNRLSQDHIRQMIRDVRGGDYPVEEVRFLDYQEWKRNKGSRLRGFSAPIFIDNSVHDMLSIEITEWINDTWNGECEQSTPTTTDGSEKSSSRSRKRSKRSATDTDTPSRS